MNSKCIICNSEYEKRTLTQQTCSEICKGEQELQRKDIYNCRCVIAKLPNEKRCLICEKSFIAEKIDSITCSKKCSERYQVESALRKYVVRHGVKFHYNQKDSQYNFDKMRKRVRKNGENL